MTDKQLKDLAVLFRNIAATLQGIGQKQSFDIVVSTTIGILSERFEDFDKERFLNYVNFADKCAGCKHMVNMSCQEGLPHRCDENPCSSFVRFK